MWGVSAIRSQEQLRELLIRRLEDFFFFLPAKLCVACEVCVYLGVQANKTETETNTQTHTGRKD